MRRLRGPRQGTFVPPPHLASHASRSRYDLRHPSDRAAVYALLLAHGTAEDVIQWVNPVLLARCLDRLGLGDDVVGPWRCALRDLGLLPTRAPVNEPAEEPASRPSAPPTALPEGRPARPSGQPAGRLGQRTAGHVGSATNGAGGLGRRPGVGAGHRDGAGGHQPTVPAA